MEVQGPLEAYSTALDVNSFCMFFTAILFFSNNIFLAAHLSLFPHKSVETIFVYTFFEYMYCYDTIVGILRAASTEDN